MSLTELKISVVIPTHNRSDALLQTLNHLAKQIFEYSWEVIIVNNNCTDDTDSVVRKCQEVFPVSLKLFHEPKPGPAAARNAGARAAQGEYLLFVDNDIIAEPDFVSRHYERLQGNPGCWITCDVMNLPEQEASVFGRYRKSLFEVIPEEWGLIETVTITGQGTSMPKEDFDRLGGFDESFFVASGEDRELGIRADASGIRILFDPTIRILQDDWAGTTIRDYCKRQRIYSQTEPFFALKHGEKNPRREMSHKNSPPEFRKDSAKLLSSKFLKRIVGSDVGQSMVIKLCEATERIAPDSLVLWRLYRVAIAGAIYRGYNEGRKMLQDRRFNNERTTS